MFRDMQRNLNRPKNSGFILLLVMAILAALTLLVINLVEVVNTEKELSIDFQHKVRSRLYAKSGIEYASAKMLALDNISDMSAAISGAYSVGRGSYAADGDFFSIFSKDANSKININDGVEAGNLESTQDGWNYVASELNPWPSANVNNNLSADTSILADGSAGTLNKSGLLNLRLRRILNAYGDVCHSRGKIPVTAIRADTGTLGDFTFTSSATTARGVSIPMPGTFAGLGDEIISNRPSAGYFDINEIKGIVNDWAAALNSKGVPNVAPSSHQNANMNFNTFFDKVTFDCTVVNFQDDRFFRLRTEGKSTWDGVWATPIPPSFRDGQYGNANQHLVLDEQSPHMWYYPNNFTDPKFRPNYLDRFPVDLTDDSGDGSDEYRMQASGGYHAKTGIYTHTAGQVVASTSNMWADHSVALINLTGASEDVKAAVFYAPVNVSYVSESMVSHVINSQETPQSYFANNTPMLYSPSDDLVFREEGLGRSSIGVRGPHFPAVKMSENGQVIPTPDPNVFNNEVQVNRLMSLTDALYLARYYDDVYTNPTGLDLNVHSFHDFKTMLTKYRKGKSYNGEVVYERSYPIPLKTVAGGAPDDYVIDFVDPSTNSFYYDSPTNTKRVFANFINPNDPDSNDIVWVSQYWIDATAVDGWDGGLFLEDYVERTLPHIFSCVRRIPGYLGAPLALTSPYMITEPYSYWGPNDPSPFKTRANLSFGMTHWDWGPPPDMGVQYYTSDIEATTQIGRQPKISIEDLVTRHTIPKVCFLPQGTFEIMSVGIVHSPQSEVLAKTTISVSLEVFQTKYFRSQQDFVSVMTKDAGVVDVAAAGVQATGDQTDNTILIGPEFKVISSATTAPYTYADRVQSKYWLSLGAKDANSQAGAEIAPNSPIGGIDNVQAWDLYLEGDPTSAGGGLANIDFNTINTLLPDYGSVEWEALSIEDPRTPLTGNLMNMLLGNVHPGRITTGHINRGDFNNVTNYCNGNILCFNYYTMLAPQSITKRQHRKIVAHGSNIKEGLMENAKEHLWAKKDGHDLDPFGGGIFFSQNGQGEFADKDPNMDPFNDPYFVDDNDTTSTHFPKNFRDVMYWPLNDKLKSWSKLATFNGSGDLIDSDSNGIPDVYDFVGPVAGEAGYPDGVPYSKAADDINSTALGFHRGFMAAWFRSPTSYPFGHPVFYTNSEHHDSNHNDFPNERTKTHLFKTIMSLHLFQLAESNTTEVANILPRQYHSRAAPQLTFQMNGSGVGTRPTQIGLGAITNDVRCLLEMFPTHNPHDPNVRIDTGYREIDISVGYYSGFDIDNSFSFEHGIKGQYFSGAFMGGMPIRGMSTTKYNMSNKNHPLFLMPDKFSEGNFPVEDVPKHVDHLPDTTAGYFYGKSHGYFWDYDHMSPVPFAFKATEELFFESDPFPWTTHPQTGYASPGAGPFGVQNQPQPRPSWASVTAAHTAKFEELGFLMQHHNDNEDANDRWRDHNHTPENSMLQVYHLAWAQPPVMAPLYKGYTEADPGSNFFGGGYVRSAGALPNWDLEDHYNTADKPDNHLLYASHTSGRGLFQQLHTRIRQKLRMNNTPECGPGSWHRVYAFWFMRFNPGQMGVDDAGNAQQGDNTTYSRSSYWGLKHTVMSQESFSGSESRYRVDDKSLAGNDQYNAAWDVDGLDQFGIWFRDDSNYKDWCSSFSDAGAYYYDGDQDLPTHVISDQKPQFTVFQNDVLGSSSYWWNDHRTSQPNMCFSIGSTLIRRAGSFGYVPKSGEMPLRWRAHYDYNRWPANSGLAGDSHYNADPDAFNRHYPGYIFDSVIDDVILGYGPDISVPGTSYFRGLFHNAYWLGEDSVAARDRHADEIRYDIEAGVKEPQLSLDLVDEVEKGSKIMALGSRIYFPGDSRDMQKRQNFSDLRFDLFLNNTSVAEYGSTHANYHASSNNYETHYFKDLSYETGMDLRARFKYTGTKREHDMALGTTDVVNESVIYNYLQGTPRLANDHEFDGGDSFTNIPYIQEFSIYFSPPGGARVFNWLEH